MRTFLSSRPGHLWGLLLPSRSFAAVGVTVLGPLAVAATASEGSPFPFSIACFFVSFPQPHLCSWAPWLPSSAIPTEPEAPSFQPVNRVCAGLDVLLVFSPILALCSLAQSICFHCWQRKGGVGGWFLPHHSRPPLFFFFFASHFFCPGGSWIFHVASLLQERLPGD